MALFPVKLSIAHKVSVAAVLLLVVSAAVVSSILVEKTTKVLVERALQDIHYLIHEKAAEFVSDIEGVEKNIRLVLKTSSLRRFIAGMQVDRSQEKIRQDVEDDFAALLDVNKSYLQLRLLNADGREEIRVERDSYGGDTRIVTLGELQDKSGREYVQRTLAKSEGELYISQIDLNREHGVIVDPRQVILRVAIPVFRENRTRPIGMVVVNYEVGHELDEFLRTFAVRNQDVFVTNELGDYLAHPQLEKTFGFLFGQPHQIQQDVPQSQSLFLSDTPWQQKSIEVEQDGQRYFYVFQRVALEGKGVRDPMVVVVRENYQRLVEKQSEALARSLYLVIILVVFGGALSLVFALRLTSPLNNIARALNNYEDDGELTINRFVSRRDELGVLARAFKNMIGKVKEGQEALKDLNASLEAQAEQRGIALKERESLHEAILRTMSDAVLTTTASGQVQSANNAAERMFGYSEHEMIGQMMARFVGNLSEEVGATHEGEDFRRGYRSDGSAFPIEVSINEGESAGEALYTVVIRDVTERIKSEKLKNEFISTVSHELRTPLTSIKGALGLIKGGVVGEMPASAAPLLDIADGNTARLLLLINDILDIQKIESGKLKIACTQVDVMPFIEKAVEENATYGVQYDVKFEVIERDDDARIYVDPDRLSQVMSNLMSNAAKFSPSGSVVEIGVANRDEHVCIYVRDFGCGISEAFKASLFEKFTQADSTDTRKVGGTGLGLSISKTLVEKQGGSIDVESAEGEGTCFYICFSRFAGDE